MNPNFKYFDAKYNVLTLWKEVWNRIKWVCFFALRTYEKISTYPGNDGIADLHSKPGAQLESVLHATYWGTGGVHPGFDNTP